MGFDVSARLRDESPFRFSTSRSNGPAASGLIILIGLSLCGGCQSAEPIRAQRLIEHQALIDFSGLSAPKMVSDAKVQGAVPTSWRQQPTDRSALYAHVQWQSATGHTGIGAAHVRLPLPVNADMVVWLARQEYSRKSGDGKLVGQWTDTLGRTWFEAENEKYHVRGFALAQGFEAWIIYLGYKLNHPPEPAEISIGSRALDTFVPMVNRIITPSETTTRPVPK